MKLTADEFSKIKDLNVRSIITQYPEIVIKAAEEARSYSDIMRELNVARTNVSARKSVEEFLLANDLKTPDYYAPEYPINRTQIEKEEILKRFVKGTKFQGSALRKWVLTYELLPYKCATEGCLLSFKVEWNGKLITLDLDHANGDNTDNRLENLRFLCPNCHSQTETYKGRNVRKSLRRVCPDCGAAKARSSDVCMKCNAKKHLKADYPPVEELEARILKEGYEALARELGISGNGIRNYLKNKLGYAPKRSKNNDA